MSEMKQKDLVVVDETHSASFCRGMSASATEWDIHSNWNISWRWVPSKKRAVKPPVSDYYLWASWRPTHNALQKPSTHWLQVNIGLSLDGLEHVVVFSCLRLHKCCYIFAHLIVLVFPDELFCFEHVPMTDGGRGASWPLSAAQQVLVQPPCQELLYCYSTVSSF